MAESFKKIAKGGWHPESKNKDGGGSRLGNFKGVQQVKGWAGMGKDDKQTEREQITARPLTALKDPYSFGAPPKRDPRAPLPPPPNMTSKQTDAYEREQAEEVEEGEEEEREREPQPYRVNTTGLSADNLPAPPRHKAVQGLGVQAGQNSGLPARKPPPTLPVRAGSSTSTNSGIFATTPGPEFSASNQAASARLAKAGVSVPGFNIGGDSVPEGRRVPLPPPRPNPESNSGQNSPALSPVPFPTTSKSQLGELSSRFASMRTSNSELSAPEQSPVVANNAGTTWQQKQAALKTASAFKKDPSSISLTEARAAASTANNFRERHGDQVVAGYQKAEKAGMVNKVQEFGSSSSTGNAGIQSWRDNIPARSSIQLRPASEIEPAQGYSEAPMSESTTLPQKKKPPPPVPKKKPALLADPGSMDLPPPIPLASKPR